MATATKSELLSAIEDKVKRATPAVRRVFLSGLKRKKKASLQSILKRVRVVGGDIKLS